MARVPVSLPQPGAPPKSRGSLKRLVILLGLGAGAFAAVLTIQFFRSGGDQPDRQQLQFATPQPVNQQLVANLKGVASGIPAPAGATDRDQVRSLMGPPDAFSISFEQDQGGKSARIVRYETWYYFEFQSAFEFVDGDLLSNMPVDDVAPLAILPRQYDPASFRRDATWADIQKLVNDPNSFYRMDLPDAYGLKTWAYYGEQLMVAFDEEGLSLVETYPLQSGVGQ